MAKSSVRAQCAQSNVIAFPVNDSAPDPSRAFMAAYHECNIARAQYELAHALTAEAYFLDLPGRPEWALSNSQRAFDQLVQAVDLLATLPAQSRIQYRLKRKMIGPVWLKAEGERYDILRAGLAADAARLGIKAR